MDLDPKAADVDGDGDIDLVAPARSGLAWYENLWGEPVVEGAQLDFTRSADLRSGIEIHSYRHDELNSGTAGARSAHAATRLSRLGSAATACSAGDGSRDGRTAR